VDVAHNGARGGSGAARQLMGARGGAVQAHVWASLVYTTSLVALYAASTLYHSTFMFQIQKLLFHKLDQCAIYVLIAGSATP